MIVCHGCIDVPQALVEAADKIKLLNYKTTTPVKFRKNYLTEELAGDWMKEIADMIQVRQDQLDYVYFSVCKGAEPHVDSLPEDQFTSTTFVIPVILPKGKSVITAEDQQMEVVKGGIYEFNHEKIHSMILEDNDSGCVVAMIAIRK